MICPFCKLDSKDYVSPPLTPEEQDALIRMLEGMVYACKQAAKIEKHLWEHMEKNRYRKD